MNRKLKLFKKDENKLKAKTELAETKLKLQSVENSLLYKRRALSKENLHNNNNNVILTTINLSSSKLPQSSTTLQSQLQTKHLKNYQQNDSTNNNFVVNDIKNSSVINNKINNNQLTEQRRHHRQSVTDNSINNTKNNYNINTNNNNINNNINNNNNNNSENTLNQKKMEINDRGKADILTMGVNTNMSLGTMFCSRCDEGFEPHEKIVNSNGELWHTQCFVCAQCFRAFQDGIFYEFEGRKYCERDFHVLFAPCCNKCGDFVIGRVIKAMAANWHPQCFCCELCTKELADCGFIRNQNRALCHECNAKVKAVGLGKHMCNKCHGIIDDQPLRFRGEVYHGYHFNCTSCNIELDSTAREVKSRPGFAANDMNELYCLRCHDKMGIPICGACRRPIEERVVTALGKNWHVEHFVCAKCEKPFLGHRHYEKRGLAYCETHYHQLFGNLCFVCNQVIGGDVFTALNKAWCVHHFACSVCDSKMTQKSKFYEYDEKPVCKKCYDRFPTELRRRLRDSHENTMKKPT